MWKIIKKIIKKIMGEYLYELLFYKYNFRTKEEYLPCKIENGKLNKDKKFLVFRFMIFDYGILAVSRDMAGNLKWAEEHGYQAVILYCSRKDHFESRWQEGNLWDKFFDQPNGYSIDDIKGSKHIYYSALNSTRYRIASISSEYYEYQKNGIHYYEKCSQLNDRIRKEFDDYFINTMSEYNRILAVSVREGYTLGIDAGIGNTDYITKQSKIADIISEIEKCIGILDAKYIFVSTEFKETIDILKEHFGDRLLYSDRHRLFVKEALEVYSGVNKLGLLNSLKKGKIELDFWENHSEQDHYFDCDRIYEYLRDVYIMSRCDFLLATRCSATTIAQIWNEDNYKYVKFFD